MNVRLIMDCDLDFTNPTVECKIKEGETGVVLSGSKKYPGCVRVKLDSGKTVYLPELMLVVGGV